MKKIFLTAFSLHLFLMLFAQPPTYVPQNGLVAWWPFNGNADDESGNGNNGSFTGSSCTTCGTRTVTAAPFSTSDRFNAFNSAYRFFSLLDLISVPNSPSLQVSSNFSVSLWLYPNSFSFGNFGVILAKWGRPDSASFRIVAQPDGKISLMTFNGTTTTALISNAPLTLSQWTNVSFTFSGRRAAVYINGTFDNSLDTMSVPLRSNNSVEIGRN
jgi:hypothetical protein